MTSRFACMLGALSLTWMAASAAQPAPTRLDSYEQAKAVADANEQQLPAEARQQLVAAQGQLLESIIPGCASPRPDTSPFTVVVELDAGGRIIRSWRKGSSPLAICFEKALAGKSLPTPPSAPFHTSFEMSFTP